MTDATRIWGILRRHPGERNAISAAQIAHALELAGETTVRRIIAEHYAEFPAPVGASGKGFYAITPADPQAGEWATHYDNNLTSRVREILRRRRKLRRKLIDLDFLQTPSGWYRTGTGNLFDDTGNPNPVPTGGAVT